MTLRWIVASLHLLALPLGLGAVVVRGRALRGTLDAAGLARVFRADNLWGAAAGLWIVTGVARAFGDLEKGAAYYLSAHVFWVKMSLLGSILLLEVWPMITLMGWRRRAARREGVDTSPASQLATISDLQAGLVIFMVFAATALARGIGS